MSCRYTKHATAMQSAYCPICTKRTQHAASVPLAIVTLSPTEQVIGVSAAMLCCSAACLAVYQARLDAVHTWHSETERALLRQLGSLSWYVAETIAHQAV